MAKCPCCGREDYWISRDDNIYTGECSSCGFLSIFNEDCFTFTVDELQEWERKASSVLDWIKEDRASERAIFEYYDSIQSIRKLLENTEEK